MPVSLSKPLLIVAGGVVAVSSGAWIYALAVNHLYWREFWIYAGIYLVPVGLVVGSLWVLLHRAPWRWALGFVLLLPSAVVWLGSLLLVVSGFKIH